MKQAIAWKRAGRVFVLTLVVMIGVAFWGIISVARELAALASGSAEFSPLGLRMFVGTKNGSLSTLQPEAGVIVVLVIPILLAGLTVMLSARPRAAERQT
jgi:hypothetical protein